MNKRIINKLLNRSQLIQEKNRGVKDLDVDFPNY